MANKLFSASYCASLTFLEAMSKYCFIFSMPMNFLLSLIAAIAVVPLPRKGSSTTSPSSVYNFMTLEANCIGNIAGCTLLDLTLAISQICLYPHSLHSFGVSLSLFTTYSPAFQNTYKSSDSLTAFRVLVVHLQFAQAGSFFQMRLSYRNNPASYAYFSRLPPTNFT